MPESMKYETHMRMFKNLDEEELTEEESFKMLALMQGQTIPWGGFGEPDMLTINLGQGIKDQIAKLGE